MSKQKINLNVPNQENQGPTLEQLETELLSRIERCQKVINGIPGNEVIQILFEDLGKTREQIDNNWHFVNDEKKLMELRITKLAIGTLLGLVNNYENDLKVASMNLQKLRNSDTEVFNDYDNEGVK